MQPSWRLRAPTDVEAAKGVQAPEVSLRIIYLNAPKLGTVLLDALDDGNDSTPCVDSPTLHAAQAPEVSLRQRLVCGEKLGVPEGGGPS